MELLIIKSGSSYIRVKENDYLLVGLDKASVFPMDQADIVEKHKASAVAAGLSEIILKKLVLQEEDYLP